MLNKVNDWSKNRSAERRDSKSQDEKEFEKFIRSGILKWNEPAIIRQTMARNVKRKKKFPGELERMESILERKNQLIERKMQEKVHDLLGKEETLVNLYRKAAEIAREREEELKEKSANLIEQIEKDKHLLKRLQGIDNEIS